MIAPLPGQLSLAPELAPDLAGLPGRPTRPANDARHAIDGPDQEGHTAAAHVDQAATWGLADVPAALREFAPADSERLRADFWRAWLPGTAPAAAALAYRQRLGAWPAAVIRNPKGGATLAGPVPMIEVRP